MQTVGSGADSATWFLRLFARLCLFLMRLQERQARLPSERTHVLRSLKGWPRRQRVFLAFCAGGLFPRRVFSLSVAGLRWLGRTQPGSSQR